MRTCACGCGTDLDSLGKRRDALYASSGHRERVRRDKDSDPRQVNRVRESAGTAPPRANRSGLQVSYRKAVEHIAQSYGPGLRHSEAIATAEALLRPVLSDRQRAQLDARTK